jgi:hypothetical protein
VNPHKFNNGDVFVVRVTRGKLLALGMLLCHGCGHPPNNHFDHGDGACAHCGCEEYREGLRQGLETVEVIEA